MENEIKELLGESYKEGMTKEEISEAFRKNLLSTGNYVNKDKAEADNRKNASRIAELESQLNGKLSDDEKKAKDYEDLKKELEAYKEADKTNKINTSKIIAENKLSEVKTLLGVKEADKEFVSFINNISNENNDISTSISSYVAKLVKDAYEKGKAESVKTDLGDMGKNSVIGKDGKPVDAIGAFAKSLAEGNVTQKPKFSNFN